MTISALAATNSVPATKAGRATSAIGVNNLKPSQCAAPNLTAIVVGTNGTNAAELQLGSAAGQTMNAGGRDDCVLGGGGNDALRGQAGVDVCIGGPGVDTFNATCETQIQ